MRPTEASKPAAVRRSGDIDVTLIEGVYNKELEEFQGPAASGCVLGKCSSFAFVQMVLPQDGESLQFGVSFGERQHRRIAAGDGFDFGERQFLTADVFGSAGCVVAGHHLTDESGFRFKGLPHVGVETAFGNVAIDGDLFIQVTLPQDSSVTLFDFGRFPGCIETMVIQGGSFRTKGEPVEAASATVAPPPLW